jgi:hypothetical protein
LAQCGNSRNAVARIREGLAAAEATGWRDHELGFLGLLAEVLAMTGAIEEGLTVLEAAEGSGAKGADAELHRLRGNLFSERGSPEADLFTSGLITASRLVIFRRWSSSVIVTGSFSVSFSRVVRFFERGGRPRGLPDWPFLKPVPRGGLP